MPGKSVPKPASTRTALYELVFTAKDPLVLGIGYAATRDFNSFLRSAEKDDAGTPNPVAGQIKYGIAEGNSQSGNFLRTFVHLGFNRDEAGKTVWDGINPHIAGRQLAMNFRFAVAGGTAMPYEPGSDGPVWWGDYADEVRGRPKSSLLDRCKATSTCPKIMETFGSLEFWDLRASPDLVGTDAKKDIELPANVRRYYFPATTHGGGRGGFNIDAAAAPAGCVLPANPNPQAEQMRALRSELVDWVTRGVEPPASRYPRLDKGQLVAPNQKAMGFPAIPHAPSLDGNINPLYEYDFGSDFRYPDLAGAISLAPPPIRRTLPSVVPNVNADGNETAGVQSVLLQVPLGTYVGWNVTAAGFSKGQICGLNGGYIPFAKTKAERMASGDPRPSIEERYASPRSLRRSCQIRCHESCSRSFPSPGRRRPPHRPGCGKFRARLAATHGAEIVTCDTRRGSTHHRAVLHSRVPHSHAEHPISRSPACDNRHYKSRNQPPSRNPEPGWEGGAT